MRSQFDDNGGGPDVNEVIAEVTTTLRNNLKRIGPIFGIVLAALVLFLGFYTVGPGERGVVRRFGKELKQTAPGLHFHIPFMERVDKVNMESVRRVEVGFNEAGVLKDEALMLTGDENIVAVQLVVQYRVADPSRFLFRLRDPERVLQSTAEVALRTLVGRTKIDDVMTNRALARETPVSAPGTNVAGAAGAGPDEVKLGSAGQGAGGADAAPQTQPAAPGARPGENEEAAAERMEKEFAAQVVDYRAQLQEDMRLLLQRLMDSYESGLEIREVKLQNVDAPDEVKDAFHAVTRAREEKEKLINQARGYAADKIPRARGEKAMLVREAEAYKEERVLKAKGDAARFDQVHKEYVDAKDVTRQRLYIETMERVLGSIKDKTLIDDNVGDSAVKLLPIGAAAARAEAAK